jgi:hypothetical protein
MIVAVKPQQERVAAEFEQPPSCLYATNRIDSKLSLMAS